jgi:outer membrane PBP1 activator LpoA protein
MKAAVPVIVASLLLLAGCGAQTEPSSVDTFQGEQRAVAQKVEDLEEAGRSREPETICADILAASLVDELEAAGSDCPQEMKKAIDDADDFDLEVLEVDVNGSSATARVRRGDDGPTATMQFTQERGDWRATALSSR